MAHVHLAGLGRLADKGCSTFLTCKKQADPTEIWRAIFDCVYELTQTLQAQCDKLFCGHPACKALDVANRIGAYVNSVLQLIDFGNADKWCSKVSALINHIQQKLAAILPRRERREVLSFRCPVPWLSNSHPFC